MKKMSVFYLAIFVILRISNCFAAQYDASDQFDINNNPSVFGYWNYGYSDTIGGEFGLFTDKHSSNYLGQWQGWGLSPSYYPDVLKDLSSGKLTLAPGENGEYCIVRWIAPVNGQYTINAMFTGFYSGSESTNADIHVFHNDTSLFDSPIMGDLSEFYNSERRVEAGDTIDFLVGIGYDDLFSWDRVILDASISQVPLPPSIVLFGSSILALIGTSLKKSKNRTIN